MLNQKLNRSFFTDVSGKVLAIILLPILLTGCVATGQPLSQVGKVVEISEEPPDASFLEIGPISASSGAGCGAYGPRGNLEATVNNLKNKAGEMGASYVLIQKTFESTSLLGCMDPHEYIIEGIAYKEGAEAWARIIADLKPLNANYRVIESTATVRRRPSLEHPIVKKFALGSIIQVIGTLPTGWVQVAKAGEPIGWVHGDSLSKETVVPGSLRPFDTTVKADSTPPLIIITSHKSDRDIKVIENLSSVRITGRATDPSGVAEVKVNGQPTSLDEDGYFAANVFLKVGENPIIVTAMDLQENIARKTFTIQRNPKTAMVRKGEIGEQKDFGRFYALIIGNNNYTHLPRLETAWNDAREIEKVLREQYGFETEVLLDASRLDILNSLNKLRNRLGQNDSFLLYYAGHGEFDKSSDRAYWLPIDAKRDNDANWILAERITSNVKRFSSNHVLIVADSCYSGTMTRSLHTQVQSRAERDKYLQKMLGKTSRTLMVSGGNEPVTDLGGVGHSVFAQVLLQALNGIEQKVFTAEEIFYSHIKESVAGKSEQTPEYSIIRNSGHNGGDFLFVRE